MLGAGVVHGKGARAHVLADEFLGLPRLSGAAAMLELEQRRVVRLHPRGGVVEGGLGGGGEVRRVAALGLGRAELSAWSC